jgi:hypothetical protein
MSKKTSKSSVSVEDAPIIPGGSGTVKGVEERSMMCGVSDFVLGLFGGEVIDYEVEDG